MQVALREFSLALDAPLETSAGRVERRDGVLVRIEADGVAGVGEATPLPGWTERLEACSDALEAVAGGLDDGSPAAALESLEGTPAARHGFALALADLEAKRAHAPLYRHLGADGRVESVPVNATIGDACVSETATAAGSAVEAGFTCVKVKVGARSVEEDARRLAAVRDAVGPDLGLRADANGAWDQGDAREAFDAFDDLGVDYVEQPLAPGDLEGLAALRGGPVGVAVDETLAVEDPVSVVEAGAADVLVLKPMVLGGPDRLRKAALLAEDAGLRSVVTTTVDAVVARTGAVHLAASLRRPEPAGLATAGYLADDVAPDPAPVEAGNARVPQSCGHGVRFEGWSV